MPKEVRKFDVIVIGGGSGLEISSQAAELGLKTAVIEPGPFGGTCLNRGCIPSKMLIHSADVAENIDRAHLFGISSKGYTVDWKRIVSRVTKTVNEDAKGIEAGNRADRNITVYKAYAKFIGHKQLQVGNDIITADKIFICAGTRPSIPPIPGLEKVPYLTSDQALFLSRQPKSLIIIGGGYISCELAHFFGALGTKVTILQRSDVLLTNEDIDISKRFTDVFKKKHDVLLNTEIVSVSKTKNGITIDCKVGGKRKTVSGEQLLVATGRVSNADKLDVAKTGIKITEKGGYVNINEYLETNVPGIWAIGDIAGKFFFKHSANLEAAYAGHNAFNPKQKQEIDYAAMPHAVFTSPQMAGVGATEQELQAKGVAYIKSIYKYDDSAMGFTIEEHDGFVKVLVDPKTRKILGCHIIGADASVLIHEVIPIMRAGLGVSAITQAIHIHPALSEVVSRAFNSLQ